MMNGSLKKVLMTKGTDFFWKSIVHINTVSNNLGVDIELEGSRLFPVDAKDFICHCLALTEKWPPRLTAELTMPLTSIRMVSDFHALVPRAFFEFFIQINNFPKLCICWFEINHLIHLMLTFDHVAGVSVVVRYLMTADEYLWWINKRHSKRLEMVVIHQWLFWKMTTLHVVQIVD